MSILFCFTASTVASDALPITKNLTEVSLGKYIQILEDPDGSLSLQDVVTDHKDQFIQSDSDVPNFGFTQSTFWIRLTLNSEINHASEWFLELDYSPMDSIEIYDRNDTGEYQTRASGDRYPFAQRDLEYHNVVFIIPVAAGESKTIYLKASTTGSMQLPLVLWQQKSFTEKVNKENYLYGIYCGIMLVVFFYNLFLYVSVRDVSYLHYVFYVLFFTSMQLAIFGFAFEYLWPNSPWLANKSLTFSLAGTLLFISLFSISFLKTKTYSPKSHLAFVIYGYAGAFLMVFSLVGSYRISIILEAALALFLTALPLVAGVYSWRAGYKPARFYLFAWLFLMFGCLAYILKSFGILPSNVITTYGAQIGSALEVILLSFALGDRINYERREKYEAKSEAVRNLEMADKLKDEFMATISHELRTPLNGMSCSLAIIEDYFKHNQDISTPIKEAEKSMFAMQSLIDDLLCFTESKTNSLAINNTELIIKDALSVTLEYYSAKCIEKDIEFVCHFDDCVSERFIGDQNKFSKVVTHLIDNAVKFTSRGKVSVDIRPLTAAIPEAPEQAILFSVYNSGGEIPTEKHDQIYHAFNQVDNSFTRTYGGLGIGLAICVVFVRLMGGSISFASDKKGTRFDVVLFFKRAPTPVISAESVPAKNRLNILIVEDNEVNQVLICKMIEKLGHDYKTAMNGEEALSQMASDEFDLVLMDCQMPVMDGYEATEIIRRNGSQVPIIAVTANALDKDRQRCYAVGMNDFISKPLRKGILESTINKWRAQSAA